MTGDVLTVGGSQALDACTLNNLLNVTQVALLVALLRWVRTPARRA